MVPDIDNSGNPKGIESHSKHHATGDAIKSINHQGG